MQPFQGVMQHHLLRGLGKLSSLMGPAEAAPKAMHAAAAVLQVDMRTLMRHMYLGMCCVCQQVMVDAGPAACERGRCCRCVAAGGITTSLVVLGSLSGPQLQVATCCASSEESSLPARLGSCKAGRG